MENTFENRNFGVESAAANAFAVSPHDENNLPFVTRGMYVGTEGNLKVEMKNGDIVTFANLAPGMVHPIMCEKVFATGTTATYIVGVY